MMKLKHLFDNRDLTNMLLGYWKHDDDQKDVMEHYRISANAVYPFYESENLNFLRFAPLDEKSVEHVKAELDFLSYLRSKSYCAVWPIPARSGAKLVVSATPWGNYVVTAFAGAIGKALPDCPFSRSMYEDVGKSLGQLHKLSADYQPNGEPCPDWQNRLQWCKDIFREYGAPFTAFNELSAVWEGLSALPQTSQNYGLIHYDFEPDNLFYSQDSHAVCPIDFDDALYHWFTMDIVKTIGSIQDELELVEECMEQAIQGFLNGYKSITPIDEAILEHSEIFRRYAGVFTYARIIRSVSEKWDNEPEWLKDLRLTLDGYLHMLEISFSVGS